MTDSIRKNDNLNNHHINSYAIALAGNPNVGKSTVFNALTGMNQHTGNWPGKTVATAVGHFWSNNCEFKIIDLPGTYSLSANSPDEEVARDAICLNNPDCVIMVVDATCLERNLNLVLQILEITDKAVLCVNLIDEAKKKLIEIDFDELSLQLGIPVVATSARSNKGLKELTDTVYEVVAKKRKTFSVITKYDDIIEKAINIIETEIKLYMPKYQHSRWLAIHLLEDTSDNSTIKSILTKYDKNLILAIDNAKKITKNINIKDKIAESIVKKSEKIFNLCVKLNCITYGNRDRKVDKILTSKLTGIPIMLLLFALIFYITIIGANYPSEWLSALFSFIQSKLYELFEFFNISKFFTGMLIDGMYRTLANVVAVMLPPMAIFFPLFTLLEDLGYLPRVAFNLDRVFCKAGASGKQSLTMLMVYIILYKNL